MHCVTCVGPCWPVRYTQPPFFSSVRTGVVAPWQGCLTGRLLPPGAGATKKGQVASFASIKVLVVGLMGVTNQAGTIGHEVVWGQGFLPRDCGSQEDLRMDFGAL